MINFPWSLDIFLLFMKSFAPAVRETGICWPHLSTFDSGEWSEWSECGQWSLLTVLRIVEGSAYHPHSERGQATKQRLTRRELFFRHGPLPCYKLGSSRVYQTALRICTRLTRHRSVMPPSIHTTQAQSLHAALALTCFLRVYSVLSMLCISWCKDKILTRRRSDNQLSLVQASWLSSSRMVSSWQPTPLVHSQYLTHITLSSYLFVASYGSLARYKDVQRLHPVGTSTVVGAGGDLSDFQYIQHILEDIMSVSASAYVSIHASLLMIHVVLKSSLTTMDTSSVLQKSTSS